MALRKIKLRNQATTDRAVVPDGERVLSPLEANLEVVVLGDEFGKIPN
jgi:hypothetical protein